MAHEWRIGFGIGETAWGRTLTPTERDFRLNSIKAKVAERFGGYTLHRGEGGWINGAGRLVEEPAVTLTIITDDSAYAVEWWAKYIGRILEQEAVVLIAPDGSAQILDSCE